VLKELKRRGNVELLDGDILRFKSANTQAKGVLRLTMNSEAQLSAHREGSGPGKASAQRVLRMLDSAMGSTVSRLLKDPDVIEIRCNADGKIFADWFDRPSHPQAPSSDHFTIRTCGGRDHD
jgi:hypothetical protein